MSFVARPPQDGQYRIKIVTADLYVTLEQGKVALKGSDKSNKNQIWRITPGARKEPWKIVCAADGSVLSPSRSWDLMSTASSANTWLIDVRDGAARIKFSDKPDLIVLADSLPNLRVASQDISTTHKFFVFEAVINADSTGGGGGDNTGGGTTGSGGGTTGSGGSTGGPSGSVTSDGQPDIGFQERFFTLKPEVAAQEEYDIIIIGTGIGGGVLAADLFDTNSKIGIQGKKILVIEKGNLTFHSHCLNASRPTGLGEDRGQQNDTFFESFKKDYAGAEKSAGGPEQWKGGPMYCLGGRSAAWGLFAPRVHDKTLDLYFPEQVTEQILGEYYEKAEKLMKLSLPLTKPEHQYLIDRLNITAEEIANVQWQWGRIASEFSEARNYDFAEGAYSTIDRLLEIAMSKPVDPKDGKEREHKNFKILLGVEARSIVWGSDGKTAVGVSARTATGNVVFKLQPQGRVVLCAGSVASPAILLRSGVPLRDMGGCRLTDHDIMFRARSFRYKNPKDRESVGSVKLQTYASIGDNDIALVNMSIDASTFLPRSKNPYDDLPKFIMVFILRAPLMEENDIRLDSSGEPIVTIARSQHDSSRTRAKKDKVMQQLTEDSMDAIAEALKVDFIPEAEDGPYFKKLQLGGVAHELGTIPMKRKNGRACLDNDMKLTNGYNGVYVCDLSVFPFSPEANPTLTLAALSIRLSRMLVPRLNIHIKDIDTLDVINHSGRDVQIFVSNQAGVAGRNEPVALGPGECKEWQRRNGTAESVFVYRINPRYDPIKRPKEPKFWNIPELLVGKPGQVLPIL